MINQYLTLLKASHELSQKCKNSQIISCATFRKNEFLLRFSNHEQLSIFLYPSKPFIFINKAEPLPSKNIFYLLKPLTGKKLTQVLLHKSDRIIKLKFTDQLTLYIQLFSASSAIHLFGNQISEHHKNEISTYSDDQFEDVDVLIHQVELLKNNLKFLPDWISKQFQTTESLTQLQKELTDIPTYQAYSYQSKNIISPFTINGFQPIHIYDKGSESLKFFVLQKIHQESFDKEKTALLKNIQRRILQLQSTIQQLKHYLTNEHTLSDLEHQANLLISQPNLYEKGLSHINLPDILTNSDEMIPVKLNPNLTLLDNANLLFQRVKNFHSLKNEKKLLLQHKQKELEQTSTLLTTLESLKTSNELKLFKKTNLTFLKERVASSSEISEPFHRIRSQFGHEILIGKHAKGNDFLLSNISKKNDIWFHCKGDSGSHVILPNSSKELPNKKWLEEAAQYAAYFSAQKKSDWVPVTYTFCKYVRKVKGAAPGAVLIDKEDVIFVKPIKPPDKT